MSTEIIWQIFIFSLYLVEIVILIWTWSNQKKFPFVLYNLGVA